MKRLIRILLFLFPVVASAQSPWYKSSPLNYAWKNVGYAGFSQSGVAFTSLAFSPSGEPYVAFQDWANSERATVMKFDGSNWVNVGKAGFSTDQAFNTKLAFNPIDSLPYVAFVDGRDGEATVMMFNGNNWVDVGYESFTPPNGSVLDLSFAISPSGQPYVAFNCTLFAEEIAVMKFDGTNWVYVGSGFLQIDRCSYPSLAISPSDGLPYVAFSSFELNQNAVVMKFDGNSWVYIGSSSGIAMGETCCESLAFSPIDTLPYLGYGDGSNESKATVLKFDGSNWINVGTEGFSAGVINYTSLAFRPTDGQLFVAYADSNHSGKATVMRFDGNNWVNVGPSDFSAGEADYTSLAFDLTGKPCVAYGGRYSLDTIKPTVMKYDSVYAGINKLQESRLSIYPNPATDKITVDLSGMSQGGNLTIVDIEGQEFIKRQIIPPKTQIDISALPSGVYFVRLTNDRIVEVGKFVKQ